MWQDKLCKLYWQVRPQASRRHWRDTRRRYIVARTAFLFRNFIKPTLKKYGASEQAFCNTQLVARACGSRALWRGLWSACHRADDGAHVVGVKLDLLARQPVSE